MKVIAIGKHNYDEIINIGNEDLKAISSYLGNKHYFAGFKPTRVSKIFLFNFHISFKYLNLQFELNDPSEEFAEYCKLLTN